MRNWINNIKIREKWKKNKNKDILNAVNILKHPFHKER